MTDEAKARSDGQRLKGKCVLIIEDEYYIGDDLRRLLEAAGTTVLGPYATLAQAQVALDRDGFDCAVVDLNLNGESAIPIAERLAREQRSFVIATGYGSGTVPSELSHIPRIEKPFDPAEVVEMLGQIV